MKLPPLRQDLRLFASAPNADGSPAWVIQDPVRNRFFRVGWLEFELLSRWELGAADALLAGVAAETPLTVTPEELDALVLFLEENELLQAGSRQAVQRLVARRKAAPRRLSWKWLAEHYLFFRIPLWRPERLLARTAPRLEFMFRPWFVLGLAAASLAGIVLAARQWDVFLATFRDYLNPGGLLGYLVALAVGKSLHELAHAYTATRYGVRVAHMGVAMVVLWPMLYTDTNEAWKLSDRRQRFRIAGAGIAAELALAGIATLLWSLVPDGGLRSALFFLATTSWIISLGINASPFMRFDGYYLLSDWLDFPNLHARSSAQARVWLRRTLLGWNAAWPEEFPRRQRALLIGFALTTWLYRLFIFIGIALLVYFFFFKLLGIILFVVEIAFFVARPVASELRVWWEHRAETQPSRRRLALALGAALALILAVPWRGQVAAPAWAHGEPQHVLYSPFPARLVSYPERGERSVQAGEVVLVLDSPELRNLVQRARASAAGLGAELSGLIALPQGGEKQKILAEKLAQQLQELAAQAAEIGRLELRAPVAGELRDLDPHLAPGAWVNTTQPLGTITAVTNWVVEAYVGHTEVDRIAVGNSAVFYPDNAGPSAFEGKVLAIDKARVQALPNPLLSAAHGGVLPVVEGEKGLVPRDALFRVLVQLEQRPDTRQVRSGGVVIHGQARALAGRWFEAAVSVLIRESGF